MAAVACPGCCGVPWLLWLTRSPAPSPHCSAVLSTTRAAAVLTKPHHRTLVDAELIKQYDFNSPDVQIDKSELRWLPKGQRVLLAHYEHPGDPRYPAKRTCSGCKRQFVHLLPCAACGVHLLCSTACHHKHWPQLKAGCKERRPENWRQLDAERTERQRRQAAAASSAHLAVLDLVEAAATVPPPIAPAPAMDDPAGIYEAVLRLLKAAEVPPELRKVRGVELPPPPHTYSSGPWSQPPFLCCRPISCTTRR